MLATFFQNLGFCLLLILAIGCCIWAFAVWDSATEDTEDTEERNDGDE